MPNEYINGLRVVQDGQKSVNLNLSNARRKTYSQLQNMTDEQKKGVIIVEDYPVPEDSDYVEVEADGEKTWSQLLDELWTKVDTTKASFNSVIIIDHSIFHMLYMGGSYVLSNCNITSQLPTVARINIRTSSSKYEYWNGTTYIDYGPNTATSGIEFHYDYYKNLDIHTEYLAKNCILTGGGNVEDDLVKAYTFQVVLSTASWSQSDGGMYYIAYENAFSVPNAKEILAVSLNGWSSLRVTDIITPYISSNKISLMSNTNSFASGDYSAVYIKVLYK